MHTANTIDADLPCVKCGYNLRTRGVDSLCPECGTPVAVSVSPAGSLFASARHAARFQRGMVLIPLSIALEAILLIQMQLAFRWYHKSPFVADFGSWYLRSYGRAINRFLPAVACVFAYGALRGDTFRRARLAALAIAIASTISALSNLAMLRFPSRAGSGPRHMYPEDALYLISELASLLSWSLVFVLLFEALGIHRMRTATISFGAILVLGFSLTELLNAAATAAMDEFGWTEGYEWPTRLYDFIGRHSDWWIHLLAPVASIAWLMIFWGLMQRVRSRGTS